MAVKTFATGEVLTASDTNTYLANSGLVYVNSVTVTSGTAATIANCFTSTYADYRVVVTNVRLSGASTLYAQMKTGSSANSNSWTWGTIRYDYGAGTVGGNKATGTASVELGRAGATTSSTSGATFDILGPAVAQWTTLTSSGIDDRGTGGYMPWLTTGSHSDAVSYDGISVFVSGVTISSMTVTVYGYRKG